MRGRGKDCGVGELRSAGGTRGVDVSGGGGGVVLVAAVGGGVLVVAADDDGRPHLDETVGVAVRARLDCGAPFIDGGAADGRGGVVAALKLAADGPARPTGPVDMRAKGRVFLASRVLPRSPGQIGFLERFGERLHALTRDGFPDVIS